MLQQAMELEEPSMRNSNLLPEKPIDDPRQAMRLYLINLGFIGDEYKNARAVLMRNFPTAGGRQSVKNTSFTFSMPEVY